VLITLERVALLRHVGLFASTPDRVLAGMAQVLEEVQVEAGEVVMREGDVGAWLFIVVTGQLRVERADRSVLIGPGSVVGELAVLDPHPRSATVTAATPGLLFRLHKAAFDEVLVARPEFARGVLVELARLLREPHAAPVPDTVPT
jgi:CRP/FNR family transcriptional regulator, cyclic AMP receptor protein